MHAKPQPTWQEKAKALLMRDPKKTGVMGVLGLVLAVMIAHAAMTDKSGPATADAGPLVDNHSQIDSGDSYKLPAKKDTSAAMRQWLSAPSAKIGRSLFAVNLDYYTQIVPKPARPAKSADQDKSALQDADELKEQDALKLAAKQLRLQTTIMSAAPQAMIDGELLKIGDRINPQAAKELTGFTVIKIEPRRVWIGRDAIKLVIEMN